MTDQELLKNLLEGSLVGIFLVKNYRYMIVNRIVERATGYTKDELYSMNALDIVSDEYKEIANSNYIKCLKGEKVKPFDVVYIRKSGERRWATVLMRRIKYKGDFAVIGNWLDVTDKKILESELQKTKEFHKMLTEGSLAGIYIVQDEKFIHVNPEMERITGYSREELYQIDPFSLIHPDYSDTVRERYLRRLRGEPVPDHYQWEILTKKGERKWVEVRSTRILYNDKPAILATVIDVDELKKRESELNRLLEYLKSLNRILRHDIINDITIIQNYLDIYLENENKEFIDKVMQRTSHIIDIINNISGLEEVSLSEERTLNLRSILEEIVSENPDVEINACCPESIEVAGNGLLKSAFWNLISNSIKHSGVKELRDLKIKLDVKEEDEFVRIVYSDNGKGIPEEIREAIFDEGFSSGSGSGFGMFFVKKVVEKYGGSIEVLESDEGAKFLIRLKKSIN
jgi:PAS domain S-box-containing protein